MNNDRKTYVLNIDFKYLESIKKGDKIHEYRLANNERKKIKIGDYLNLVSKENNANLLVEVTNIEVFKTWELALKNYWESDFKNVYNSLEETIKNCLKFYSKEDVEVYGIIVFSIKKI